MHLSRLLRLTSILILLVTGGCASLPENTARHESFAFENPASTALGKKVNQQKAEHPDGQSGFHLLSDGYDAFVARAALAQIAEHSIDSQYYMVHGDLLGSLYVSHLLQAADRGVRVRFLLDDMDEGHRDFGLANFDMHPNIEVRIFNPFGRNTGKTIQFVTGLGKQTRRSHNKSFTVDNAVTIVGGRNIGDEYFAAGKDMDFADLDVIGAGPVAQEVTASFDQYWNSPLSYPIRLLSKELPTDEDYQKGRQRLADYVASQSDSAYVDHLQNSSLTKDIRNKSVKYYWGPGKVYADPPEKLSVETGDTAYMMMVDLKPYMAAAEKELTIISPYFVPGPKGAKFLTDLKEKGIRVRILTNSLSSTDVRIVHAGYARYRKRLLRAGIELYELNKETPKESRKAFSKGKIGVSSTSLHAKTFVVDRKTVFIGSLNLDQRSVVQNTEIGIVLESKEIANILTGNFDKKIDRVAFKVGLDTDAEGNEHTTWTGIIDGEKTTLTTEPYTTFWSRFVTSFMRLLPIESQI
jgi:putative cardiolipin synthase